MPYRLFDLQQAAEYLHLAREDIERLVKEREIPFEKRGNRFVFRKVEMDAWASERILKLQGGRLVEYHAKSSKAAATFLPHQPMMEDMIEPSFVEPGLPAKTKASAIREMVSLACLTVRVADVRGLLESVQAREELCSTGMPGGLALLHPRQPDPVLIEQPFVAVGRTPVPVPFGAPDGLPTDLFFLLGCPDDRLHLHTLARLCMMTQKTDLLQRLRQVTTCDEMREQLVQAEAVVLALMP